MSGVPPIRKSNQKMQSLPPGTVFSIVKFLPYKSPGLEPTVSTYDHGPNLEDVPRLGEEYIVCDDGSVISEMNSGRVIGWCVYHRGPYYYWQVTQSNHIGKPCQVVIKGIIEPPPKGNGFVGAVWYHPENALVYESL